jgi:hypothetical protein
VAVLMAIAAPAEAKHWKYHSRHPYKGGFCYIEVAHTHGYAPVDGRVYRMVDGEYYFVGDPVAYGYAGPRYAYYGEHPVVEVGIHFGEPEYCYLEGPHYHWYAPPPETHFEARSGVYWYVGNFEPVYWRARPRYVVINEVYRPMRYERPAVVVSQAPPTWRGAPPPQPTWRGSPPPPQAVRAHPAAAEPQTQVHIGVGVQMGHPPPAPTYVERRVYVGGPPGHNKGRGHDDDRGRGHDDDRGHGNGHGRGHHKGR